MQGSVFKQWYGSRRFTIALIAIVTILLITLGVAIYSYITAYTAVTNYSAIKFQAELLQPTNKEAEVTAPSTDSINATSSINNESGGKVDASISTGSNTTKPSVTVNGTPITVPTNGSVQQQVPTNDGNATVNVQVHSDSTNDTSSGSYSSLHVNLNSSSTTRSDDE